MDASAMVCSIGQACRISGKIEAAAVASGNEPGMSADLARNAALIRLTRSERSDVRLIAAHFVLMLLRCLYKRTPSDEHAGASMYERREPAPGQALYASSMLAVAAPVILAHVLADSQVVKMQKSKG